MKPLLHIAVLFFVFICGNSFRQGGAFWPARHALQSQQRVAQHSPGHSQPLVLRLGRDDFIDVEVVEPPDSEKKSEREKGQGLTRQGQGREEGEGVLGLLGKAAKTVGDGLKGLAFSALGQLARRTEEKEAEVRRREARRERRAELGREVDGLFKGRGLAGSLMGSALKVLGEALAEGLEGSLGDVEAVQGEVQRLLERQGEARALLGEGPLSSLPPSSSSSSTFSINGQVSRELSLLYLVQGSRGAGTVEVTARLEGQRLRGLEGRVAFRGGQILPIRSSGDSLNGNVIDV